MLHDDVAGKTGRIVGRRGRMARSSMISYRTGTNSFKARDTSCRQRNSSESFTEMNLPGCTYPGDQTLRVDVLTEVGLQWSQTVGTASTRRLQFFGAQKIVWQRQYDVH